MNDLYLTLLEVYLTLLFLYPKTYEELIKDDSGL